MDTSSKEKIRMAVREQYAQIANVDAEILQQESQSTCCSTAGKIRRKTAVRCCGPVDCTSLEDADPCGYSLQDLENAPLGSNMGLGCGNPVAIASLKPGETVVDLGSGGGFDCFLAAQRVGENGQVIGVDMTPEMVAKARRNADHNKIGNVSFRLGEIEHLPVADNSTDMVMSNCVINLSPEKKSVYKEALRILKPGGRMVIADILANAPLPEKIRDDLSLVSACIGGAATIQETREMLAEAGFDNIRIESRQVNREMIESCSSDADEGISGLIVSADIQATKPLI